MANFPTGGSGGLSYAQLEGLWIRAGGPAGQAPTAAAIALAESGGQPGATNPTDNNGTQTSWGLWQISNGTHSAPSPKWSVPGVNARLAVAKWRAAGRSFSPWGTFNSGAYKKFMNNGTSPDFSAAGGGTGPGVSATIGGPGGGSGADPGCLVGFTVPNLVSLPLVGGIGGGGQICLVRKSWARAFIGGGLIVGGGLVLFGATAILVGAGLAKTQAVQEGAQLVGFVKAPYSAVGGAVQRQWRRKPGPSRGRGPSKTESAGRESSSAAGATGQAAAGQ